MNTAFNSNEFQASVVPQPVGYKLQVYGALLVLVTIPVLCILGNQAGLLRMVFPPLSVAVGGFLLWRSKPLYVGLVFWLWFVTPFLSRIADFQAGWTPASPVELAPYVTAGRSHLPVRFPPFCMVSLWDSPICLYSMFCVLYSTGLCQLSSACSSTKIANFILSSGGRLKDRFSMACSLSVLMGFISSSFFRNGTVFGCSMWK